MHRHIVSWRYCIDRKLSRSSSGGEQSSEAARLVQLLA